MCAVKSVNVVISIFERCSGYTTIITLTLCRILPIVLKRQLKTLDKNIRLFSSVKVNCVRLGSFGML